MATGKVKIKLPLSRNEMEDKEVVLNGKIYQIKRGFEVEVPRGVAEILQHQEHMLSESMKYEAQAAANANQ